MAVRARILIVDDNHDLAGTLRDVLMTAFTDRLEVTIAETGASALERAKAEGFDVAIVDVKLPDASGIGLIAPLREASRGGEIVLITGFASMDAAMAALRSGAYAMILKSFRPEELVTTVEQALTKVRLQKERAELEARYRAVVDLTDVMVIAVDTEGKVSLFNRKAARVTGVAANEARGRDFVASWIADEDRERMRDAMNLVRSGPPRDLETAFIDGTGGKRRIRWHLSSGPHHLEPGAPVLYGVGIDVTERRALEKRAADAEAMSVMGNLALNLAHEIRNPLNAAKLQLHLLGRDSHKLDIDDETRAAFLRRVAIVGDEIERLARLLTEFLELARPRGLAHDAVAIDQLLDSVLALEREAAESRGVRIVREISPTTVTGDAEKLKQVLLNLVVNALEAMRDGGTLTARITSGDRVVVEVEDTGIGMDKDTLRQVFEPFFTTKEAGTGLGLSIVRKIVDQHGGDVTIESERGKGTRVRVALSHEQARTSSRAIT